MITPTGITMGMTIMLDDFLTRAILAGLGVILAAGPLGCFVIWRRMAYFGDATAHAAILGVALALGFSVSITVGVVFICALMAIGVVFLSRNGLATDASLGVLSHGALATGLVAVSFFPRAQADLMSYLFGDIFSVGIGDLAVIWIGALALLALTVWRWKAWLTVTLNQDLAVSAGLHPKREELILTLALAVLIALALQTIGALLIAALLVIPAASARALSDTPEAMAIWATVLGAVSVLSGVGLSLKIDSPSGPSITLAAFVLFALIAIWKLVSQMRD